MPPRLLLHFTGRSLGSSTLWRALHVWRHMVHARWNMPEIIVRKGLVGAGSIDLTSRSLGSACSNHHFRSCRRLLPRRPESHALRTCARIGDVLGRCADTLAQYT